MYFNWTFTFPSPEQLLFKFQSVILVIIILVLMRILLVRFLTSLMNRGVVSASTKNTISRFIDVIVIFIILVTVLNVFVPPDIVVIAVSIFIVSSFILFFYEIREFVAYINLQLLRHIKGKSYEIRLPSHAAPVYGRIIDVEPMVSTLEDIYGKRIYIANSLLVNAIIKEYVPSVQLRIKLNTGEIDPLKVVDDLIKSIEEIDLGIFRIDSKKIMIEKIGVGEVVARIRAYPVSTPIRLSDLVRLANEINKSLIKYNPEIEFIESTA